MERMYTIELRANFADESKYEELKKSLQRLAVELHAVTCLLSDGQRPLCTITGVGIYTRPEDIELMSKQRNHQTDAVVADDGTQISDELLAALK